MGASAQTGSRNMEGTEKNEIAVPDSLCDRQYIMGSISTLSDNPVAEPLEHSDNFTSHVDGQKD